MDTRADSKHLRQAGPAAALAGALALRRLATPIGLAEPKTSVADAKAMRRIALGTVAANMPPVGAPAVAKAVF